MFKGVVCGGKARGRAEVEDVAGGGLTGEGGGEMCEELHVVLQAESRWNSVG